MTTTTLYHPKLAGFYAKLSDTLQGDCDFTDAGVALYTSDASNYRQIPLGVVYPQNSDDIRQISRLCREHDLPVLMRGGGTSQNGQCVNRAVILDCSRYMTRLVTMDTEQRTAQVEPGIICDALKAAAELHGLTFGPDPATHSRCTLGGMIGNNSCGPHSMLAGKTVENVIALEVLSADGDQFWTGPTTDVQLQQIIDRGDGQSRIYAELKALVDEYADDIRARFPTIKRRVSGYNLDQLLPENGFNVARALVGSEGTCVSVLQAQVRLIENPAFKRLVVLGYDDIYQCGDSVPALMPFKPIAMEGLDQTIIGGLKARNLKSREIALLPEGCAWMLVEIAANSASALETQCAAFEQGMCATPLVRSVRQITDAADTAAIWSIREQGASATAMSLDPHAPDPVVGWEDTAVDPLQLGNYLREFQALVDQYEYTTSLYGHFGDGCIHARITFDTRSTDGVQHWRQFSHDMAHLVVKYGGSLSGEHGDGQAKAEFLPIMFGERLMQAFRRFKAAWDPRGAMNPGKLIDAYRMDENLRFGPEYTRPATPTTLQFIEDAGGFARSTERCIGMGKCRAQQGAMCPSYQASGQERYSTRGRAHLLHEMIRGEIITDGWNNQSIADSLEHCLSCKACQHECPTQVDIAAYKSEFMAAHYQHKRRPFYHHVLGHIGALLPTLARAPNVTNYLQNSVVGTLMKRVLGIHAHKSLPALSMQPFSAWVRQHADRVDKHFCWFGDNTLPAVVLWSDSLNAHCRAHLLQSAVSVLKKCGLQVAVARLHFCCGRPLYEYGYLKQARKQLTHILEHFEPHLPAEASVVVLEPSCLSVFRDELQRLYPHDARAKHLAQRTKGLATLLNELNIKPHTQLAHGIMHRHCHTKASGGDDEQRLMQDCFVALSEPEVGCCGMAGVFGARNATRSLGQTLFARRLKPAIDAMQQDTVVITDGFSCHEQIADNTQGTTRHPVEILDSCLPASVTES